MRVKGWVLAVAMATTVSACAPAENSFGVSGKGYPEGAREVVDGADWARAETVEVDLAEFGFLPETLVFRKGQPYALRLKNTGSVTHRFMAPGFFRAIAAKSLMYSDGEASLPLLEAIAVGSQDTKTLYFVPLTPGDYRLSCDVPLHAMFGMVGRILIE